MTDSLLVALRGLDPVALRELYRQCQSDTREEDAFGCGIWDPRLTWELFRNRLIDQLLASVPASEEKPKKILDELHRLLTHYGIASLRAEHSDLVTDLVHWAADACRQTRELEKARSVSEEPPDDQGSRLIGDVSEGNRP